MTITPHELFTEFGIDYIGPVKWDEEFQANYRGVYIISLSPDPKCTIPDKMEFSLCPLVFEGWIKEAKHLEIKGEKVLVLDQIKNYLEDFWHIDQNVLYIGESSSDTASVAKRVNQYYSHKVGKQGPHTGGYWLKLLSCLKQVYIFHGQAENPREAEFKMLMRFVEKSKAKNFYEIDNFSKYFPFANLKIDVQKSHDIRKYTNKGAKTVP